MTRSGHDNFFAFGLTVDGVTELKASGYRPRSIYESNASLAEAIDLIADGAFSNGDRELFRPLVDSLLTRDEYLLLADYQAFVDCQERVSDAYRRTTDWTRMAILNTARVGRFSSDRSIRQVLSRDLARDAGRCAREPMKQAGPCRNSRSSITWRMPAGMVPIGQSSPTGPGRTETIW